MFSRTITISCLSYRREKFAHLIAKTGPSHIAAETLIKSGTEIIL